MLRRRYVILFLVLWAVATTSGCGSRQPSEPPVPVDENLERVSRGAHMAFGKGAYEQAVELYRETLEYAYARDDREMIVDTQYNLAIALLRLGALAESRMAVEGAKSELLRSNSREALVLPAHLRLLDATLLFHDGQAEAAWDISEQVLANTNGAEPEVLSKLHVLRGLIAAERGDQQQLRTSLAALETANSSAFDVDRAELRGHLAMAERNWGAAVEAFVTAAALQQEALDYSNMSRSLALAGEASVQMGQAQEAAVFFFRAGRSAARLEMTEDALQWLTQAQQLADHTGDARLRKDIESHLITLKARVAGNGIR